MFKGRLSSYFSSAISSYDCWWQNILTHVALLHVLHSKALCLANSFLPSLWFLVADDLNTFRI